MTDYYWLNDDSRTFLSRGYIYKDETPEQRIQDIGNNAEKILGIEGFAQKFVNYMAKGYYSLSTPIWSNFGRERGLPIACFGSYVPDDINKILSKVAEVGSMSAGGGGTSAYFGDVRPRGSAIRNNGTSTGVHHQLTVFNSLINYVSQGNVRRGAFAAYLPVDHDDFDEFMKIKDLGDPIQDISIGICISDEWMKSMIAGDKGKRERWLKIIQKRSETGYPYIIFTDNANNQAPQVFKDNNLKINASNLCTEIFLPSNESESFVCDLMSINAEKWPEIEQEPDVIRIGIMLLDAVMTEFINKTEHMVHMQAARKFGINHRALGLGVLGWHSYLQRKGIAFESMEAKFENIAVFSAIRKQCDQATKELAELFGEPPLLKGYGVRNSTVMAIAPNTSSSFILGQVSPGIEPLNCNYYVKDLAKGKFTYRNPYLHKLLIDKGQDTKAVWKSILIRGGSVQHLEFLTKEEKDVFKTFGEISQKEIVIQAAQRQKFIDQGQSLNLMISPDIPVKEISALMVFAWEQGIKSLYYQRSTNPAQELARSILTCESCGG